MVVLKKQLVFYLVFINKVAHCELGVGYTYYQACFDFPRECWTDQNGFIFYLVVGFLKSKSRDFSIKICFGPYNMMLASAPFLLEDPSMYRVHQSSSCDACNSSKKSTRLWWGHVIHIVYWIMRVLQPKPLSFRLGQVSTVSFGWDSRFWRWSSDYGNMVLVFWL